MIRYEPTSTSKLAKATHIIEAELKAFTATPWEAVEGIRLDGRLVSAELALLRFWKGEPAAGQPATVALEFEQYAYQQGIIRFALPGVWSRHSLEVGASYFLLLNTSSAANLEEPACFFVETAAAARLDVEMTDRSGCPPNRLRVLLGEVAADLPRFGTLFCEYAASRIPEMFFDYPDDFHALFRMVENDAAPARLRWIWLREIFAWLTMMDPAAPTFLARTVAGSVRLAARSGPDLRQALLAVYLPNLLGISSGLVRKKAADVFANLPGTVANIAEILDSDANLPNREALLAWIREP